MGRALSRLVCFALIVICVLILLTGRAHAHAIGLSNGEYAASTDGVKAKLTFARGDAIALAPALDRNHDGALDDAEVNAGRADIEHAIATGVLVTKSASPCAATLADARLTDQDGIAVTAQFACEAGASEITVHATFLEELSYGHRHMAKVTGATTTDEVLYRSHPSFTTATTTTTSNSRPTSEAQLSTGGEQRAGAPATASPSTPPSRLPSFVRMGVEHILTGYDHLVFLFALILVRGKIRELLKVVTAFTVAHSITLGIAALGIYTPSARIVEPAIALSIAWVGIENFFVKDAKNRWRITFPFGLIHGFGFAGALREIELPRADVPVALLGFNLGVELGQLAAMAVMLPLVWLVREKTAASTRVVRWASTAVVIAGGIWFVARVAT